MPAFGAATAASLRKTLPLVVLSATALTLGVVKWRAERRSAALALARANPGAALHAGGDAGTVREPALAAAGPLGDGRVSPDGARTLHEDAARTHRARGRAPRAPHERWHVELGGPIVAQPVLAPDERTVYATSLAGTLSALDRGRSGAVRWRVSLGDRAYATPLVMDDGMIFVGSDAKKFFAVTPAGAVAWTLDLDGEADTAAVALGADRMAFAAGSTLFVVTTRGEVKARFRARKKIFTSPAVTTGAPSEAAGSAIYFGSQDHRAYAVRPDGTLLWSTDLDADVDGGPAVGDDGAVFFGTDGGRVVKLDPERGEVAWSSRLGGYVRGALGVARDGSVLAGVYGPTPGLLRLAAGDGRLLGAFRVPGTGSPEFGVQGGALEDDEGTLVFGAEDDRVSGLERSGRVRFALDRGADVDAPVTLTRDGALIVGSDDGTLVELAD
jgi:outer membrane protein assembly factor BamB